jgi:hypothetical protein
MPGLRKPGCEDQRRPARVHQLSKPLGVLGLPAGRGRDLDGGPDQERIGLPPGTGRGCGMLRRMSAPAPEPERYGPVID